MATWPTTLPNALADGYQLAPVDPSVRTDMEVGAPRARRRTSARNDRVSVRWVMTDTQLDALRDWYDDATTGIAGGSAWFNITLNLGTGASATWEARFASIWTADFISKDRWKVSATLEVRD